MSLSTHLDGRSEVRAARQALARAPAGYPSRLGEAMGPSVDDTQIRQRMMVMVTFAGVFRDESAEARTFYNAVIAALPRNHQAMTMTLDGHAVRRAISQDATLGRYALEIADANGPLWDFLRSAILTSSRDSMVGSLGRLYEDGVENATASSPTRALVARFFDRLETTSPRLHEVATSRLERNVITGWVGISAPPSFDYTNGPRPGDVLDAPLPIGRDVPPAQPQARQTGGRSGGGGGGGPSSADYASMGGFSLPAGAGDPRLAGVDPYAAPSQESGVGDAVEVAKIIKRLAANMGLTTLKIWQITRDCIALYYYFKRASGRSTAIATSGAEGEPVHRFLNEAYGIVETMSGNVNNVSSVSMAGRYNPDPVANVLGRG